ncbi:MAG: hypothetical protein JXR20_12960, partial [Balneola sp.]
MENTKESLKKDWQELKKEEPKLRIKNAADKLGVSEVELVATLENATRLNEDWPGIFTDIETLGYVMALTRNESVVHERKGEYHNISFNGHAGLVLDPNIDLRIFPSQFGFAYAVPVENPRGTLHSIQFFNKQGVAAHKIYLMNEEHLDDYSNLVEKFSHEDQDAELKITPAPAPKEKDTSTAIDTEAFLQEWSELQDTHDFYGLLRKFKVERTHALEIAEGRFTQRVENETTATMLNKAAEKEVPIMVFVSSGAVIQIHSGKVEKIKKMDNWLNVLDSEFNLHLREDHISKSWVVEKPTEDGIVTSVEIFDADDNNIATFFGARKPGIPELESWREL